MKMIYHCPYPLNLESKSASGIRPLKMLEAFKSFGFEVELISGYSQERKLKIKELKRKIELGESFSFLYSENATLPLPLTDQHHLPIRPNLDFNFFKFCKENKIKTSLFYRDIYWQFPSFYEDVSKWKYFVSKFFYHYELAQFSKYLDIVYLPSRGMQKFFPDKFDLNFKSLPPGADFRDVADESDAKSIKLLYIGGISAIYKLNLIVEAVKRIKSIELTLCVRREEWEKEKANYNLLAEHTNIKIVHKHGKELESLYQNSNICILYVEPHEYRNFAVPLKLFEYVSYRKPIIASKNTLVGDIVSKNNIGWSVEYDLTSIENLLQYINNEEIIKKSKNVELFYNENTWISRVKQVCTDLDIALK